MQLPIGVGYGLDFVLGYLCLGFLRIRSCHEGTFADQPGDKQLSLADLHVALFCLKTRRTGTCSFVRFCGCSELSQSKIRDFTCPSIVQQAVVAGESSMEHNRTAV